MKCEDCICFRSTLYAIGNGYGCAAAPKDEEDHIKLPKTFNGSYYNWGYKDCPRDSERRELLQNQLLDDEDFSEASPDGIVDRNGTVLHNWDEVLVKSCDPPRSEYRGVVMVADSTPSRLRVFSNGKWYTTQAKWVCLLKRHDGNSSRGDRRE